MGRDDRLDGVDGVVVINLDRRPDRWAAFRKTWSARLPMERVERLPAVDGRALPGFGRAPWFRGRKRDAVWAGRAGVALSHRRALETARARGWNTVLVFEDDAVPSTGFDARRVSAALARPDWDLLYLGCAEPNGPFQDIQPGLSRISGALDLHAYAVRAGLRDRLLEQAPHEDRIWSWIARERAVDRWMRRAASRHGRVLTFWPSLVVQDEGPSDITQRARGQDPAQRGETPPLAPRASDALRPLADRAEALADRLRAPFKRLFGF